VRNAKHTSKTVYWQNLQAARSAFEVPRDRGLLWKLNCLAGVGTDCATLGAEKVCSALFPEVLDLLEVSPGVSLFWASFSLVAGVLESSAVVSVAATSLVATVDSSSRMLSAFIWLLARDFGTRYPTKKCFPEVLSTQIILQLLLQFNQWSRN
jgi:hypothetical protein